MARAMRSLTLPPGFRNSHLPRTGTGSSAATRARRTIGVLPTRARIDVDACIPAFSRSRRRASRPGFSPLRQVEEDDVRRVADGGVVAGEREAAGLRVHPEYGHLVRPLVAAVQE